MSEQLVRTESDGGIYTVTLNRPAIGVFKHLSLRFVLGWTPEEFAASLFNLAEGRIDGAALVTGEVGIEGVPQAFADLADPERHVKILVRPS